MSHVRHVKRIGNIFWYGGFGLLILVAVLLSLARLLMPQLQGYHHELERRVGAQLGVEVTIGSVDARLVGVTPTLILSQLLLREGDGEARIDEVGIGLDSLDSLFAWRPVLKRLSVDGAHLSVEREQDGRIRVHGLGHAPRGDGLGEASGNGALPWLLSQGGLRLRNTQVSWIDTLRDERFDFRAIAMELRNDGDRHQLRAGLTLPESLGAELNLAVDLLGPGDDPKQWYGDVYIKGTGLLPAPWLPPVSGLKLQQGSVDLELWTRWDDGQPGELEGRIVATELSLESEHGRQHWPHLESRLYAYFSEAGWRLDLAGLRLEPTSGPEPSNAISSNLSIENSGDYWRLQADYLPLNPLLNLARISDALAPNWRDSLAAMQGSGGLFAVRLEHDGRRGPRAVAVAHDLSWTAYGTLPGVKGLNGTLSYNAQGAELRLMSQAVSTDFPRLFRQPLEASELRGSLFLRRQDDGWRLHGRRLALSNSDIQAALELDLQLPKDSPPYLDLRGRFWDGDAAAAPRYYPVGLMRKETVAWLDRAFKGGRVVSGGLLYHGQLKKDEFPFREHQGRFEVRFDTRAVTLDYREDWPPLQQVDGEVRFEGAGMSITGAGRLYDSPVEEVEVRIDDLKQPLLQVHGHASPRGQDVSRLLRESPLSQQLGKAVTQMQLEGQGRLQLDLKIPLSRRVAEALPLKVEGRLELEDSRLKVREGITLERLNGSLGFSEAAVKSEGLEAELFGAPLQIAAFTEKRGEIPHTRIAARGRASGEQLSKNLSLPYLNHLHGEAPWQALIDVEHGGGREASLRIDSDMQGMAVGLPRPLGKAAQEEGGELSLTVHLAGEHAGLSELKYGERVHALFQSGEDAALQRASMNFGVGRAELPESEVFHLSGALEQVLAREWLAVLAAGHGVAGGEALALPLVVDMQRLSLLADDTVEVTAAEPVRQAHSLPPMDISLGALSYAGIELGRLKLRLAPAEGGGFTVDGLRLKHPHYEANVEGAWQPQSGDSVMKFRVNSEDIGDASKALGFASVISDGRAEMNGELRWPGAPQDIALERVAGKLNIFIHDGLIEEINPGAGKLLGLLSLQALPKRLILDFGDVFNKGMPFDKIAALVTLEHGNLYTQNLRMQSLTADVLVSGRSGLLARDYDQLVVVVPKVSETLPVAAGLALGPQAGAVLLLLQGLIGDEIDRSAAVSYSVKGSWEDPRIEQLALPPAGTVAE